MSTQEYEQRILDQLNTLWQARGTPQPHIAKALGLKPSQVSKRFNGHVRMSAAELMVILKTLGVDPGEFFVGVEGGFHAELYLAQIEKEDQRRRKYAKSDRQRDAPLKPYTVKELRQLAEGLEELRIVDANEACRQALEVVRAVRHQGLDIGPRAECLARVILGSVYRLRGSRGTAAFFLRDALRIAGRDGSLRGRTLQTVMSLAADLGDYSTALGAVRASLVGYSSAGDWHGVGKALVSAGVLLVNHGDTSEAQDCLYILPWLLTERSSG